MPDESGTGVVNPNAVRFEQLPGFDALVNRLRFAPELGHIWLDERRMFLMHTVTLAALRRELIENFGIEQARGLLTRMGYLAGTRYADTARRMGPKLQSTFEAFAIGPQLLTVEGINVSEAVEIRLDVERGRYYGEYLWRHSIECESYVEDYQTGADPVCWMQIGYACGFATAFLGRTVLHREVECRAMGNPTCRLVGKPAEEWHDPEEDLRYFQAQPFANRRVFSFGAATDARPARGAAPSGARHGERSLVGISGGFNIVCHMINRVAATGAPVLFLGESGVGKEMFARTVHGASGRADRPLVTVNCAAIPETLIEGELFGVERGAYTGATASRPGRFERADNGTLFLDEIGTLSLTAQGKLLRAIQEGEIERIGDTRVRKVDVRIVAATNEDLEAAVARGAFRADLYYRLNVFPIRIPPLRERGEDIAVLTDYFLQRYRRMHGREITGFTERALDALRAYGWPGNVRELENVVERAVILAVDGGAIDIVHLPPALTSRSTDRARAPSGEGGAGPRTAAEGRDPDLPLPSLALTEARLFRATLERCRGNLSAAAKDLGITRARLAYRARKLGLEELFRRRS